MVEGEIVNIPKIKMLNNKKSEVKEITNPVLEEIKQDKLKNDTKTETVKKIETPHSDIKTKKKVRRTKAVVDKEIETDLAKLLKLTFNILAVKGGAHWQLKEDEATALARPTVRLLKKYNLLEKAQNISDGVMLATTATMIVIPRIMINIQENKKKKVRVINGQASKSKDIKTKAREINRNNQERNQPPILDIDNPLYTADLRQVN